MSDTRHRIIDSALELFGEKGFASASVAEIEHRAGLRSGSGGLYRHFDSKKSLLVEALDTRLSDRMGWEGLLSPETSVTSVMRSLAPDEPLIGQLTALLRVGMARLDHDRDVNRLLMRDNSVDPAALEVFRKREYEVIASVVQKALAELAPSSSAGDDWGPVAAVVVGAVVHFWLISDIFGGTHPSGLDVETYLGATATLIATRLQGGEMR